MRFPHKPHRNPKGLTKADKEAQKSDDLLKRDFTAEKPLEKAVTDITEIAGNNGNSMFLHILTVSILKF